MSELRQTGANGEQLAPPRKKIRLKGKRPTAVLQDAAHVWAEARTRGIPSTDDDRLGDERLDGDAIRIAPVRALGDLTHVAVTPDNMPYLEPFVPAVRRQDFEVEHGE